jgi:excisionase family DNA binding protein
MSKHLVVATTDAVGLALLRRHPRFRVALSAPSGTEQPSPAPIGANSDGDSMQRLALSVREAAQAIGLSERKLRDLIAAGDVPAFHVDRSVRVRVSDLESYAARLVTDEASWPTANVKEHS